MTTRKFIDARTREVLPGPVSARLRNALVRVEAIDAAFIRGEWIEVLPGDDGARLVTYGKPGERGD